MKIKQIKRGLLLAATLVGLVLIFNAGYIHAKAQLAQLLISSAWADTLETGNQVKPWPWADTWPVARLSVPSLGVNQYVLSGATGAPLAFGPGHHLSTVLPGKRGVSLIAGHRDTHFSFLEKTHPDQEVFIEDMGGQLHRYSITKRTIRDIRKGPLTIDTSNDQLDMVTCYPFNAINPGGPLRLVVTAERVDDVDQKTKSLSF